MEKYRIIYLDENGQEGEIIIKELTMRAALFEFEKRYNEREILMCQKIN